VAPVTRPVTWLAGFLRVALEPGEAARVTFTLHADRTAFTGRRPAPDRRAGRDRVAIGASERDIRGEGSVRLTGQRARGRARPRPHHTRLPPCAADTSRS
jgi:hypothetical protein